MSSSGECKPCPSCAAVGSFETSKAGAEELVFCSVCGYIDSDSKGNLVDCDDFEVKGEFYAYDAQVKFDGDRGITHGKTRSAMIRKKPILDAVGQLGLPNNTKNGALELFDRILPHVNSSRTRTLGLACLFIVVNRDSTMHIPLSDYCRRINHNKSSIVKAKRWILAKGFHEHDNPEKLLDALIAKRLGERDIPVVYEKKVKRLMALVKKGWVSEGRPDEMFLWPCLFVLANSEAECVWRAAEDDPDGEPNKATFAKKMKRSAFFKEYGVKDFISESAFLRNCQHVTGFLLTLTERVPWLPAKKRGTEAGLFKSLDWILDNQAFCGELIERGNESVHPELKEFLPPVHMKVPKAKPAEEVLVVDSVPEGEELDERDIRDEDMDQYIRSPQEIENIQKLMTKYPSDGR